MATAARSRQTANQSANQPSEARDDAADSTAWLRNDGVLENAITGLNDPDYDKTVHTVVVGPKRLSYIEQQNLYEGSWICRRICDAYPIEGTREWVDVTLGGNAKPELATKFMQYQERLDVKDVFKLGQTWANIYKGAAAIIHVDDGRKPDEPINRNNVRSILDIEVLDYLDIRPNTTVSLNPLRPDYYELVNRTNLSDAKDGQLNNFRNYHPDRIIRFDGFALPPKAMIRNQNWGGSLLDSVFTAFNRYESGNAAAANMVQDFNVFIYALKNLGNLIGANDEKSLLTLRNRLKSLRLTMSNLKGLVIDAEGESASFISRNFAGLAEVLDRFRDELIGASGLPHTAVFGDAAGGLGSTGESEEVTWAKMVNQFQETTFRKKLRPVFELIWLAKDGPTKGKIPDDWSFSFNPLVQESEKEKLETRTAQSQIDNTYLTAGVLMKEEVRTSRFGGSDYNYETTLDEEAWKKAQEEDQFDFSGMGLGDEGGEEGGGEPPIDGTDPNGDGGAPAPPDGNGNGAAVRNGNAKQDSADARKRVEKVQGLSLDVTHNVGDWRFGQPMQVEYARIRGSYGHAKDGRAHDVVKGPNPNSTKLFKFYQKNPATGLLDETKYGIGFDDIMSARDGWASMLPGGIHSPLYGSVDDADWSELQQYRQDCSADCDCDLPVTKPANKTPLLRLRRKQKPFGRELELIEDEPEDDDRATKTPAIPNGARAKTTKQKQKSVTDADEESERVDGGDRADAATQAKSKNAGKGKPCGEGSISPEKECRIGEGGEQSSSSTSAKKGGVNPLLIGAGVAIAGLGVAAIANRNQKEEQPSSEAVTPMLNASPDRPSNAVEPIDNPTLVTPVPPEPKVVTPPVEAKAKVSLTTKLTSKLDNELSDYQSFMESASVDELKGVADGNFGIIPDRMMYEAESIENDTERQNLVKKIEEGFENLRGTAKQKLNSSKSERLSQYTFDFKPIDDFDEAVPGMQEWRSFKTANQDLLKQEKYEEKAKDQAYIQGHIEDLGRKAEYKSGFLGLQSDGKLQAMALVKETSDGMMVDWLVTAPWNVVPHSDSVKGSGSALMERVFQLSKERGHGGKVYIGGYSGTSGGFYRAMGAKATTQGTFISSEDAEKFLASRTEARAAQQRHDSVQKKSANTRGLFVSTSLTEAVFTPFVMASKRSDRATTDADDIPESEKDFSDRVTDKALLEATPAVNIWIAQVQRQLKTWRRQGLTLQEIRDRLPALYKKLKSEAFAKTLNQSMQLTYLGARAEALDELGDEAGQEESDRLDAKGKQCGNGWTAAENECQTEKEPTSKKKGGVNPLLIGAGVAAVGLGVAAIAASNQQANASSSPTPSSQPSPEPEAEPVPKTTALKLVIPAKALVTLRERYPDGLEGKTINTSELRELISQANYFLSTTTEDADAKRAELETTTEGNPDGNNEVYLRVHINNGVKKLNQKIPYVIKRDLPEDGQHTIQENSYLKTLNGLENFNII